MSLSFDHDEVVITSDNVTGRRNKVQLFGSRVTIPEFEIVNFPTIRLSEVKSRRFSMLDSYEGELFDHDQIIINSEGLTGNRRNIRMMPPPFYIQKMKEQIMAQEDAEIFKALDSIFSIEQSGNKDI